MTTTTATATINVLAGNSETRTRLVAARVAGAEAVSVPETWAIRCVGASIDLSQLSKASIHWRVESS